MRYHQETDGSPWMLDLTHVHPTLLITRDCSFLCLEFRNSTNSASNSEMASGMQKRTVSRCTSTGVGRETSMGLVASISPFVLRPVRQLFSKDLGRHARGSQMLKDSVLAWMSRLRMTRGPSHAGTRSLPDASLLTSPKLPVRSSATSEWSRKEMTATSTTRSLA